jgi:post-segregation antitoxin (ccd killing protein)
VCMSRVNIYLPDDLADAARRAELNVSAIAREALLEHLAGRDTARWVARVDALSPTGVGHDAALEALHGARDEFG